MNKSFLFDLDGVLINDEQIWEDKKQVLYRELFGHDVVVNIGSTLGVNIDGIYERAVALGAKTSKQELTDAFYELAEGIYGTAPIPDGLDELAKTLNMLNYRIGIVSASPLLWITTVTKRLTFEKDIEVIISLTERTDLAHKPAPDGYLEAMRVLGATPETTIILEDSNSGIKSAKASGALTVGLRQNLAAGYRQVGADQFAETIEDVIKIVAKNSKSLNSSLL
jgi:HAD superfamily hydrolase (TIGR01509 family)